jgi:hypothetical protein
MKRNQTGCEERGGRWVKPAIQLFSVLAMGVLLMGCKPEAKVGAPVIDVAGTYALQSVNGNTVPCKVEHDGRSFEVKSGSFVLNAEGTCASSMLISVSDKPIERKATYTREGSKFTMKWVGAGVNTGTLDGSVFTMQNEGMTFTYRK